MHIPVGQSWGTPDGRHVLADHKIFNLQTGESIFRVRLGIAPKPEAEVLLPAAVNPPKVVGISLSSTADSQPFNRL